MLVLVIYHRRILLDGSFAAFFEQLRGIIPVFIITCVVARLTFFLKPTMRRAHVSVC